MVAEIFPTAIRAPLATGTNRRWTIHRPVIDEVGLELPSLRNIRAITPDEWQGSASLGKILLEPGKDARGAHRTQPDIQALARISQESSHLVVELAAESEGCVRLAAQVRAAPRGAHDGEMYPRIPKRTDNPVLDVIQADGGTRTAAITGQETRTDDA